jgi:hypothetical protein
MPLQGWGGRNQKRASRRRPGYCQHAAAVSEKPENAKTGLVERPPAGPHDKVSKLGMCALKNDMNIFINDIYVTKRAHGCIYRESGRKRKYGK